jgi:transposase-like protein
MDIPYTGFTQSEDIPDSGRHALEETDSMKERVKFVMEWESEGRINFAELCRELGISRQVGYVWLRRHREAKWS